MAKAIEIEDFSYGYPDGTSALSNITLSVEHGQKVALIGPNGAGKSTLLLSMAGFVKGTGKVLIDGLQISRKNLKRFAPPLAPAWRTPTTNYLCQDCSTTWRLARLIWASKPSR